MQSTLQRSRGLRGRDRRPLMATRTTEAEARLNQLGARVDAWRQTRPRHARMPQELWREATELGEELGATTVQQTLSLNRAALLRRMKEREQADGNDQTPVFVELPRVQAPPAADLVVELEDGAGGRMTLRLRSGSTLDVAQVIRAFRGTP